MGLIKCAVNILKNNKIQYQVTYQDEKYRTLSPKVNLYYKCSNGWTVISSSFPPHIEIKSRGIWIRGSDELYDETVFVCDCEGIAMIIVAEIKQAINEASGKEFGRHIFK